MDREAWYLALELLDRCDLGTDLRVLAMAHLGAAVMLFERFDPEMAEALLATVDRTFTIT